MRIKDIFLSRIAAICLFLTAITVFVGAVPVAHAAAGNDNIKIIAWYGAGNLSKSEYGRDTIILFNPTQRSIPMTKWSIQQGGAAGGFSAVTYLLPDVTIPPGGFYAITGSGPTYISSGGCSSNHCNLNYDYDYQLYTLEGTNKPDQNSLSSTAQTVALVSTQTPLGTCPKTSANLVDLVGIGASDGSSPVTCFAGTSYAPYTPGTLEGAPTNINGVVYAYATVRKNRCGDTFNNANDWMLGFIDFANSKSTPQPCPTGNQLAVTATATPSTTGLLDPVTFTAKVTPATGPTSANIHVTADLSNLGLSATSTLYDDGTHGDTVAGDNTFSLATASVSRAVLLINVPGIIVTATDANGDLARAPISYALSIGNFVLSTTTPNATVNPGEVATFPFSIESQHGYGGIISVTCTGTPNENTLGVPISTQCVATPPQIQMTPNGTTKFSLAVATGTTFSAGILQRTLPLTLISLLSIGLLAMSVRRRRSLPVIALMALVALLMINTTACEANAGLGNTSAASGTYTYTVRGSDSNLSAVTNAVTINVTVK